MKIAYFDTIGGISGDMILAAFLDAGFDIGDLKDGLSKLNLKGYKISKEVVTRHHIKATRLIIDYEKNKNKRFTPEEIRSIINKSTLKNEIKEKALKIFNKLCEVERKIHKEKKDLHLHELGHIDTILDTVGISICLAKWNIKKIYYSNVKFGRSYIKTDSGVIPLPAPASLELMKGIPVKFSNIDKELITPTGAAVLNALGTYTSEPELNLEKIGYGAGDRDLDVIPNVLRIAAGEECPSYKEDSVTVIESAIDDTAPIVYSYLYDELFKRGALDVYITNIQMKKNRPGHLLTVISPDHLTKQISEVIFRETNTIGVRYYKANRYKLYRNIKTIKTKFGSVQVKLSGTEKELYKASPEFESCKSIAKRKKIPFKKVYEEAKKVAALVLFFAFLPFQYIYCDTVYLKDGNEIKGIVVEEYKDRIVISTESGEVDKPKSEIKNIKYDLLEQNLVALAEKYKRIGDYERAYFYYEKAAKVNPQYKEAQDGMNYVSGFLFRKELGRKEDEVAWRQEVEDYQKEKSKQEASALLKLELLVGIEIKDSGRDIKVTKVFAGLAARKAGIEEGDVISAVWGKLTGYMSCEELAGEMTKQANLELKVDIDRIVPIKRRTISKEVLDLRFEGLYLAKIKDGSRPYKAGLRNEDFIISINGESIRYTPLNEIIKMLDSKSESDICIRRELTVWRTQ